MISKGLLRGEDGFIFPVIVTLTLLMTCCNASGADAPAEIRVYDTTCSCFTASNRIFNCKSILRSIARAGVFGRKKQKTVASVYRKATSTVIKNYLDSNGYFHPRWDSTSGKVIRIFPGKRSFVIRERIISIRPPPPDSLEPLPIPSYPRPFDAEELCKRAESIGRIYTRNGYPFVSVTTDFFPVDSLDSVEFFFHVDPDEYYLFDFPRLSGSFSTRRELLLSDISIKPGSKFDDREIGLSLDRLRTRSYVSSAEALSPVIAKKADTSHASEHRIVVPFVVTDRSGMGFDGAMGLEVGNGEKPRFYGNILFSFANLFHGGEDARFSYTGDRLRQRLDIGFMRPWMFGLPLIVTACGGLEVVSETYGYLFGHLGVFYEPAVRWYAGVRLVGHTVSKNTEAAVENGSFAGADLVLSRQCEPYSDGVSGREFGFSVGSGVARKNRLYNRSHVDFTASGHLPLHYHTAIMLRVSSGYILTREDDLVASEKYRVGGFSSLRGYMEDEFDFSSVIYGQSEYLYYFQPKAPIYMLLDGGIGFENRIGIRGAYRAMCGYGIGVRIPAAVGTLSIEWARNIADTRSLGRIHAGFKNSFSTTSGAGFAFKRK